MDVSEFTEKILNFAFLNYDENLEYKNEDFIYLEKIFKKILSRKLTFEEMVWIKVLVEKSPVFRNLLVDYVENKALEDVIEEINKRKDKKQEVYCNLYKSINFYYFQNNILNDYFPLKKFDVAGDNNLLTLQKNENYRITFANINDIYFNIKLILIFKKDRDFFFLEQILFKIITNQRFKITQNIKFVNKDNILYNRNFSNIINDSIKINNPINDNLKLILNNTHIYILDIKDFIKINIDEVLRIKITIEEKDVICEILFPDKTIDFKTNRENAYNDIKNKILYCNEIFDINKFFKYFNNSENYFLSVSKALNYKLIEINMDNKFIRIPLKEFLTLDVESRNYLFY